MLADSHKDRNSICSTHPGRDEPITGFAPHTVLGTPIEPPYPPDFERALFGMGCFWGVEKLFWQIEGVHTTAVGYGAGSTPNPTYQEVCSGMTGHNELVMVVYNPKCVLYRDLLKYFWENHNPTQGLRQGNDVGSQYRSGIYPLTPEQHFLAKQSVDLYSAKVKMSIDDSVDASYKAKQYRLGSGAPKPEAHGKVTTEVVNNPAFYFAEEYHQQYLAKNPGGYCNMQDRSKTGLPALT